MTLTPTYNAYHFGTSMQLSAPQLNRLVRLFASQPPKTSSALGGRRSVSSHQIDGLGSVVVKHYARGGVIRHLIKRRYLRWGKTRGQLEYELMLKVKRLGINVPEPLVYAFSGHFFYRAWLVTTEIEHPLTLARLSLSDEKRARRIMMTTLEQIALLIENHILHVDLHPGNVVVDHKDRVFLVDFDKGRTYPGSKNKLRARYLTRWQRAVSKHRLPEMLTQTMRAGLKNR